jgi:hypothetical protein
MAAPLDATRDAWKNTPRPFANFRTGRVSALTFGIECDLDHQMSYIETMLEALNNWSPHWDFEFRAQHELRDLREFESRIDALELPTEESQPLLRYTKATRDLLEQIVEEAGSRKRLGH